MERLDPARRLGAVARGQLVEGARDLQDLPRECVLLCAGDAGNAVEQRRGGHDVARGGEDLAGPEHLGTGRGDRGRVEHLPGCWGIEADSPEVVEERCSLKVLDVGFVQVQVSAHRDDKLGHAFGMSFANQPAELCSHTLGFEPLCFNAAISLRV